MHSALRSTLLCLLSTSGLVVLAGPVQPIASDTVSDKFRTLSPENQRLAGLLASRLRANSEGFLERFDYRQLIEPYTRDHAEPGNAEAAGRFLSAAAGAYEYRQDPELLNLMNRTAAALADSQAHGGYIGIPASSRQASISTFRVQRANLLGLLAHYRATGEERAYSAAQKLGDYLVKSFAGVDGSNKIQLPNDDLELKLAAAGLVEPLTILYRYTAETAYLDLARAILRAADLAASPESGNMQSNSALASKWLDALTAHAVLYRATGDLSYLRTALRGWESYARNRMLETGVPSAANASEVSNCLTTAWMKLTLQLLSITGQQQFADRLEKTIFNQLLAGQDARNGDVCAATALSGRKQFLSRSNAMLSNCALAESEALALIPDAIWGRWSNGIAINLYTAGRGIFELRRRARVQIYSETSYPDRGDILLHVEPSRKARFPLRLRVPEWAPTFSVDYGASHILGKPGEYLLIDREWKRGDTVKITIGMRLQALRGKGASENRFAIQRGPEVLVLSRTLNPDIADLAKASLPLPRQSNVQVLPLENKLPRYWAGEEAYQIDGEYAGKPHVFTFVPFADAFDFVMWLPQAGKAPGTL